MAREGISFEQVALVAQALAEQGQSPTIRAVRERLGSGSPNTIHKHLVAWRTTRPTTTVMKAELPQALTIAIAAEIGLAAAQARAEIEKCLEQAQAEALDLAAAGELLESERDELAVQVGTLTSMLDKLAGKADQQGADLGKALELIEIEKQAAETSRVELAAERMRVEQQRQALAQLDPLRTELEQARQGRIAAEKQAAVQTAKLEAATHRADSAEARIVHLQQSLDEARNAEINARELAAKLTGQIESAIARQGQMQKIIDEASKMQVKTIAPGEHKRGSKANDQR